MEKLLSETDCPYLPPVPFRGKRNEPLYVKYVVEEIARQKEMDIYICSKRLMDNAIELFTPNL
jgi:TatD DNase family protein